MAAVMNSSELCFHCQLPLPDSHALQVSVDGESRAVCCPACRAAVQFIHDLKLDDYYRFRSQCDTSTVPGKAANQSDDDSLREAVQCDPQGHFKINLLITDIRCVACTWLIEQVLQRLPDVLDVSANFASRRVTISFQAPLNVVNIAERLRALGYTVKADQPDAARDAYKAERKQMLMRLGIAGIGMMQVMMFALASYLGGNDIERAYEDLMRWASFALTTPVVFFSAWPFHRAAWYALANRSLVMDVPVSLAILAAWVLSVYSTLTGGAEVYFDTACMFTFFLLIGRFAELVSRFHFQQSQDMLEHLLPRHVTMQDGSRRSLDALRPGDLIAVAAGEIIPADGVVIEGLGGVSEAAFTGEPMPMHKEPGSRVLAGSQNHDGSFVIRVATDPAQFVIRQIAHLYEQASRYRPRWAQLADQTARYFVGAVLLIAAAAGLFWYQAGNPEFLVIALTVLVVACPCALSLATPVAYSVATTTLRRHGVVIKNGMFLERAAATQAIVFDKTGTLTQARLQIRQTIPLADSDSQTCLEIASALEQQSQHPIAQAFSAPHSLPVDEISIIPGSGVSARMQGQDYRIGHIDFALNNDSNAIAACQALLPPSDNAVTVVILSRDKRALAAFYLQDSPRPESAEVISQTHTLGLHTAVFTGDRSLVAQQIQDRFGVRQVQTAMSPDDKVQAMRELQKQYRVMMVGDGINDTAAMAAADTSLCVSPTDTFVQNSADATLVNNTLTLLPRILQFARRSRRIIRQNIVWSVSYNFTVIPFALLGMVPPWLAALGMSLSSVLVVGNAARLTRLGG
ncbi:heavy metal translocating P-type ATPase [Pseudohongiella spirulinae]|uniref:Cation transport ATPase, E1-E2 family protein n=1 Tax=Pseudohongiella spirulinae TaxID=1249552 RepID=A0A0S2KG91_9GAMM|nr:heavy metal translocating P-type ATPase [Pseudohongiella spirulinae]ALO47205.1 Cation transport ATPase, E1-E2 family protein [Pseudohongiella spirulinae]